MKRVVLNGIMGSEEKKQRTTGGWGREISLFNWGGKVRIERT